MREQQNGVHNVLLEEGIQCFFSSGLSLEKLVLGASPSRSLMISGLPSEISQYSVESRLSPFGQLLKLSIRQEPNHTSSVTAVFKEPAEVASAAKALHGSPVGSWINCVNSSKQSRRFPGKSFQQAQNTVSVVLRNNDSRSQGIKIKAQWFIPSSSAWVHFRYSHQAKLAANRCNKQVLHGCEVSAMYQTPSLRQKTSFSVSVRSIPPSVSSGQLKQFIERHSKCKILSLSLSKSPITEKTAPGVVQKLLSKHGGPCTSFQLSPQWSGAKQKALIKFSSPKDADSACRFFSSKSSVTELGGGKLFLQRIYSLKYALPWSVFISGVKDEIEKALSQFPSVRLSIFPDPHTASVSIHSDSQEEISHVKVTVDPIVSGEALREPKGGSIIWDRFVSSMAFSRELETRLGRDAGIVWCDRRRRRICISGREETKNKAKKVVLETWVASKTETHAVPMAREEYSFLLQNGRVLLDKLSAASGATMVSLDIKHCAMLVQGTPTQASKARKYLSMKLSNGRNDEEEDCEVCPVCFCPPEEAERLPLACGHKYCEDCFETWLTSANMCRFPVACLAEGCSKKLSLVDLCENLSLDQLDGLRRAALDDFVRRNPTALQFCPVVTCPGIYEVVDGEKLSTCSTCSISICTDCHTPSHGKLTCKEFAMTTLSPSQLRAKIVDDILTLQCPRCKQAFLDFDVALQSDAVYALVVFVDGASSIAELMHMRMS